MVKTKNSFAALQDRGGGQTAEAVARSKAGKHHPTDDVGGSRTPQPPLRPAAPATRAPAPPALHSGRGHPSLGQVGGSKALPGDGGKRGESSGGRRPKRARLGDLFDSLKERGEATPALQSRAVLESVNWGVEARDICQLNCHLKGFYHGMEKVEGTNHLTEVVVKRFPKTDHAERYFEFMQNSTHNSLLRVRGLYQTADYDIISFEPVHTTLASLLKNMSGLLLTEDLDENNAVDFQALMIGYMSDIFSGIEEVHMLDGCYGDLLPDQIFIQIDENYSEGNSRYAKIKLPVPKQENPEKLSKMQLDAEQRKDFKKMGHLVNKLRYLDERLKMQVHIQDLETRLNNGGIKTLHQLKLHSSMWNPGQQSLVLLASDMLKTDQFSGKKFPDGDWRDSFTELLDVLPEHRSIGPQSPPKVSSGASTSKTPSSHAKKKRRSPLKVKHDASFWKKKNRVGKFYKLGRNVVAHFEDPYDPKKVEFYEIVGNNRGTALRYLRGFYPNLFPSMASDCLTHQSELWKSLMETLVC